MIGRVDNISRLVTNVPGGSDALGIVERATVVFEEGRVAWAGPSAEAPSARGPVLDVEGRTVLPGFVDPHTHLVFAGDRADEFSRRIAGASYSEIADAGGGIAATMAATRAASAETLYEESSARARAMLEAGTTTVEIKSGYGLDQVSEVKILEVAKRIGADMPLDVVTTFLGAHSVPPGVDRAEYLAQVTGPMMEACAPLAQYVDVFCDKGAFTLEEARDILAAGGRAGMRARIHAEQLARTGAAGLAAELDAVSADHLDHISREDAEAMAQHGVVGVLLPGAALSMRAGGSFFGVLRDAGVTVALATDCNPGTSYWVSMRSIVALAVGLFGMEVTDAIWSATRGGALALEDSRKGIVARGATADLVVLDASNPVDLAYRPDSTGVWAVVKDGVRVV